MTSLTTEQQATPGGTVWYSRPWSFSAVSRLKGLAIRGLGQMYRPEKELFAFTLRRRNGELQLEGVSLRYTAIALLGLAGEEASIQAGILDGAHAADLCSRILRAADPIENLGDLALMLRAAAALEVDDVKPAWDRLRAFEPDKQPHPTVELAWTLDALVASVPGTAGNEPLVHAVADRLMHSFSSRAGVFPHWPAGSRRSILRGHVSCFADQVYPIESLARYHRWSGRSEARAIAARCAERICGLQGADGQWWWHYDTRSGRVIEGYPVYSVHQDAMAPMALFALRDACGVDYGSAVERGMGWLQQPAEIPDSLIDEGAGVIWRKVARHEPGKFSRGAQALASRVHPALRVPGLATLLRPTSVDYECRPYHLGWLLYAWSDRVPSA
ncbi:MAG: hypothetical protein IID37_08420 [Planctomycetes bacterium]|nr:hypothetical protein [Planctomycetota bacterium]